MKHVAMFRFSISMSFQKDFSIIQLNISFKYYADGLRFIKTNGHTQTKVNYNLNGEVISQREDRQRCVRGTSKFRPMEPGTGEEG
ncbi:hypothetical protein JI735_30765 [Paenibacillus sonchi]|uniref:Uncharacterized protein n=1 Tax=Paenibacillus sonchi TaxID=373687 RepID=A0A974PCJ5_9BACL|nr:hypothetical protein [Paenibacillus sonchi]QQZ60787.1 hypothetical protein JI735_30765 [Paenibacillus sonchi]